jgi:hypothetical protein
MKGGAGSALVERLALTLSSPACYQVKALLVSSPFLT